MYLFRFQTDRRRNDPKSLIYDAKKSRWYAPESCSVSKYEHEGTEPHPKSEFLRIWMLDRRCSGIFELSMVWADWDESAQKSILSKTIAIVIRLMQSRSCVSRWWFFAITCHVPSAESSKAINAFGSLSSDIARKHFDRAMRKLSYLKYASDTYQAIRIVCPVCQNMPNTFNLASFDTLVSNLTESFILPKPRIFHFMDFCIC